MELADGREAEADPAGDPVGRLEGDTGEGVIAPGEAGLGQGGIQAAPGVGVGQEHDAALAHRVRQREAAGHGEAGPPLRQFRRVPLGPDEYHPRLCMAAPRPERAPQETLE